MADSRKQDWIKIALVIFVGYLFITYINKEKMDNTEMGEIYEGYTPNEYETMSYEQPQMMEMVENTMPQQQPQPQLQPQPQQLQPDDLLPKYDDANEFVKENPVSKLLKEQNFLISGHHIGINTVMQSNKIPYHDLRAAPPIPKETVSPFLNSSYEQPMGANIKPLIT